MPGLAESTYSGYMKETSDGQIRAHFDERAISYDDWWLATGSFAERTRPGWSEEVEQLIAIVRGLAPARVLDVAAGTGFLTQHLRGDVVALDQSAPMVEIAAARMPHARVVQGEALPLPFNDREFDRIFTSHFFHHLEPDGREAFIAEARRVAHEVVVVEGTRAADDPPEEWHERTGSDGATHRFYRRSFTAAELVEELGGGQVLHEGRWFVVVAEISRVQHA